MTRRAFTLVELLLVLAIVGILLGLISHAWSRARWHAHVTKEHATLRRLLDDAVIRGGIRTQKRYDEARAAIERQIKTGLKQGQ